MLKYLITALDDLRSTVMREQTANSPTNSLHPFGRVAQKRKMWIGGSDTEATGQVGSGGLGVGGGGRWEVPSCSSCRDGLGSRV